jgi:hypothetical protein
MSQTLFVEFRNDGFWAFDVVSAVFLKHLIDAANSCPERSTQAWLDCAIKHWRYTAVCGDCGLYLDDGWSIEQIATLTSLAREACQALAQRDEISAAEIESWQMLEGEHGRWFARGLSRIKTASAKRQGEAIIALVNGTLPEPPTGTWWFFSVQEHAPIMRKREHESEADDLLSSESKIELEQLVVRLYRELSGPSDDA